MQPECEMQSELLTQLESVQDLEEDRLLNDPVMQRVMKRFFDRQMKDYKGTTNREAHPEDLSDQRRVVSDANKIMGLEQAQQTAGRALVEAEKFKAQIEKPPGRVSNRFVSEIEQHVKPVR